MNNRPSTRLLFALVAMACAGGASAAGQSVYACTRADGTIELTSKNAGPQCELMAASDTPEPAAEAAPAPDAARASASVASAASAAAGSADKPAEDPRKAYRDAMVRSARTSDASAPTNNPSLSRRYLAVDRATYLKNLAAGATQ